MQSGPGALVVGAVLLVALLAPSATVAQEAEAPPAGPPQPLPGPSLRLESLRVTPRYARPGGTVRVEAVVANVGTAAGRQVRLVPAVSGGAYASIAWEVVDVLEAGPVGSLEPGQQVRLSATVRVLEGGVPKVGAVIVADGHVISPTGKVVRGAQPGSLASQIGLLGGVFGALALLVITGLRWSGLPRSAAPLRPMVAGGGLAMVAGAVMWAHAGPFAGRGIEVGLALFAAGWGATFAGLRPRGRAAPALPLAATAYLAVGLAWVLVRGVGLLGLPVGEAIRPSSLLGAWAWAFELAQAIGLLRPPGP